MIDCPVPGCQHKVESDNGLWTHLMHDHKKNHLAGALIKRIQDDLQFKKWVLTCEDCEGS